MDIKLCCPDWGWDRGWAVGSWRRLENPPTGPWKELGTVDSLTLDCWTPKLLDSKFLLP